MGVVSDHRYSLEIVQLFPGCDGRAATQPGSSSTVQLPGGFGLCPAPPGRAFAADQLVDDRRIADVPEGYVNALRLGVNQRPQRLPTVLERRIAQTLLCPHRQQRRKHNDR